MRSTRSLRPAVLLTLALFVASGIGVPVHHHADHEGEHTHLTAGEHGHGATLVVRDMRTERPGMTLDLPVTSTVTTMSEPGHRERRTVFGAPSTPRGRSPPASCRPRAPPLPS